jgi:hypothetical protein
LVFGSQFTTVGNDSDIGLGSWILQEFNMHWLVVYIGLSGFKLNSGGKFFVWVPFGKMFSIWLKFFSLRLISVSLECEILCYLGWFCLAIISASSHVWKTLGRNALQFLTLHVWL